MEDPKENPFLVSTSLGEEDGSELNEEDEEKSIKYMNDWEEEHEGEVEREEYDNEVNRKKSLISLGSGSWDKEIPESLDDDEYHVNEMKTADNEYVKGSRTGPFKLSEANCNEIKEVYKSMNRQSMWKLSSGRLMEEELFRLGKDLEFE
ncbi:hypothetical protein BC936DRAFT_138570 [Jimgerdemannia flammicorona]|uniref:Uncharacterized protein n=1 Tax=Jimgerdemannia flammicorona TaxID=994334 RepID=A0A433C3I6_9FUNG|nr:hypothetical protein BC936DRAFT_138570 [Jimgerdemannia flammicorona]